MRAATAAFADSTACALGVITAVWSRFDFNLAADKWGAAAAIAATAAALHAVIGPIFSLYRGRYGYGTVDEVRALLGTVVTMAVALLAIDVSAQPRPVPASSPLVGAALALVLMLGLRYAHRLHRERLLRPDRSRATPTLLFGAGSAGHHLAQAILANPASDYLPVGVVDDDLTKRGLRVHGVTVLGGRRELPDVLARTGATTVIFSVANADAALIRDVRHTCHVAGVAFKIVPSATELLAGSARVGDVRDADLGDLLGRRRSANGAGPEVGPGSALVTERRNPGWCVGDLLGRDQVDTGHRPAASYLTGARVLVTGAGGSIGSELCRQLSRFPVAELMMLDRDESALHAVQLAIRGRALLDSPELILADLRDHDTVRRIFADRRPDVVFHAAALKHLTLLQRHPGEAVKTNIWGTCGVLDAARDVTKFVNISTDKAADPISVLGYTKRITERLTAYASMSHPGTFLSVRFGNVLGSRGSVLTTFARQAAAGGPLTVTHPDVTRYFMTVAEAVGLVIHAAAIGHDGEVLVLDMGDPVRIAEVAQHVAASHIVDPPGEPDVEPASGRPHATLAGESHPPEIVFTGLRPGEKLHEALFGANEVDRRPSHPLISQVAVPPLGPDQVRDLDLSGEPESVIRALAQLCGRGMPHQSLGGVTSAAAARRGRNGAPVAAPATVPTAAPAAAPVAADIGPGRGAR